MSPPGERRGPATGPQRRDGHHTTEHGECTPAASQSERPRQGTLDEVFEDGLRARDEGAAAAELSLHTGWRLWAEHELELLAEAGEPFTADQLRAVVGDPPDGLHINGVGGMFLRASKAGRIEFVGYRVSQRPQARGRPVRVWRGVS